MCRQCAPPSSNKCSLNWLWAQSFRVCCYDPPQHTAHEALRQRAESAEAKGVAAAAAAQATAEAERAAREAHSTVAADIDGALGMLTQERDAAAADAQVPCLTRF